MNAKFLGLSLICANALYAADISSLSGSVSLTENEQKQDTAISRQGNGQAKVFGQVGGPDNFTLNGANNANYVLNIADNATTFYMGGITLNQAAQFGLVGFHTLALERTGVSVGANSLFAVISSGNIINTQATDYGGASKVRFSQNATLSLENGAKATFSNAQFFIHDGKIELAPNSTLEVTASKAIRVQRELTSTDATIKLNGDVYNIGNKIAGFQTSASNWISEGGVIEVNGNFYNGGDALIDKTGDILPGFNTFDPYYDGGGNLSLKNTTMRVSGKFVSSPSNDPDILSKVELYGSTLSVTNGFENKQGSSLIFGALNGNMGKIEGDLTNDNGKVLIDTKDLSFDTNYQIVTGNISGVTNIELLNPNSSFLNVICENGSVSITQKSSSNASSSCTNTPSGNTGGSGGDSSGNSGSGGNSGGSSGGGSTGGDSGNSGSGSGNSSGGSGNSGGSSGNTGGSGSTGNSGNTGSGGNSGNSGSGNSGSGSGNSGSGSGGNTGGSTGGNSGNSGGSSGNTGNSGGSSGQTVFDEYKNSLNTQDQTLLGSLVDRFGGEDKLLGSSGVDVKETMKTINKSVEDNLITRPKTLLSAFKSDAMVAPLAQNFVSRPTASNDLIRLDNGSLISGLDYSGKDFYANAFGGALRASDLKGYLSGFNLGLSSYDENYLIQGQLSYARGSSTQDLDTQSSKTIGDFIQLGLFSRIDFYSALELDLNLNAVAGFFSLQSDSFINALLSSRSKFNTQELNGGFVLGYRFGDVFSFKPFIGLQHYLTHQNDFQEEGGLGIESQAYTHYVLGGIIGAETRLELENSAFVFAKLSYENKLYNSHKNVFFRVNNQSLKYKNESFDNSLQASIGASIFSINNTRLSIEAIYKYYDSGLNYYGGNLMLKYGF